MGSSPISLIMDKINIEDLFIQGKQLNFSQTLVRSQSKSMRIVVKVTRNKNENETPLVSYLEVKDYKTNQTFQFGILQNAINKYNEL